MKTKNEIVILFEFFCRLFVQKSFVSQKFSSPAVLVMKLFISQAPSMGERSLAGV